jgi:energy-coupling factor transport system ATP-binding protein
VADRPTRELFADADALERWQLEPPQPVALSNGLAADAGIDGALPALSVDEVVAGLGGDGALDGTDAGTTMDEGESEADEEKEFPTTGDDDPISEGGDDR